MFCGSGGSKGRLAKAKIARPCGATRVLKPKYYNTSAKLRWKCAALWREVDMSKSGRCCAPKQKFWKAPQCRGALGSWDAQKVHAIVAGSGYWSQNAKSTTCSRHFWRLRCPKSERRCGAKKVSKSKCRKHTMFRALLGVELSKINRIDK